MVVPRSLQEAPRVRASALRLFMREAKRAHARVRERAFAKEREQACACYGKRPASLSMQGCERL
eukprot:923565-Pleurochrysis_carterae.AAC.2